MQEFITPENIFKFAIEGYLDSSRFYAIEKSRDLTSREVIEQSIAAVKLILFGPAALTITLDRLFTRR